MKPLLLAGLAAGAAIPALGLSLRYRRDMDAARARLAAVNRHIISTRWGAVEYAERGSGAPVLTSALQLALRHPEKVKHLAVLVANLPGSPTAIVQPSWTKRVNRQFIMWALRTFAPSTTARLVAAVPRGFAMSGDHTRYVCEFIDSLFPMSPEGYNFDLFISNADVTNYNLEAIRVPTLIADTKDDQLASHEASQRATERIPGARFVSLESGGHLMLGQTKSIRDALADFFAERKDRRAA